MCIFFLLIPTLDMITGEAKDSVFSERTRNDSLLYEYDLTNTIKC